MGVERRRIRRQPREGSEKFDGIRRDGEMVEFARAGSGTDPDDDQPGALRREVRDVYVGAVGHLHRDARPALVPIREARGHGGGASVVLPPRE